MPQVVQTEGRTAAAFMDVTRVSSCIFCELDRPTIAESVLSIAFFDRFPVSRGHALVVPKRHVVTVWELSEDEYADTFALVREVKNVLYTLYKPDGFNVGVNSGEAAGQSVWHAHIHVIPRYAADVPNPRGGVRNIIPGKGNY
jgi:diadenosine tetraphosphate (Ap4A) HIT family hydrolase